MESRGRGPKGNGGKKGNKKQHYKQLFQAGKRSEELQKGMTGFLVTCDPFKEQRSVKEIFNVLNDWVEKMYPQLDIEGIANEAAAIRKQKKLEQLQKGQQKPPGQVEETKGEE